MLRRCYKYLRLKNNYGDEHFGVADDIFELYENELMRRLSGSIYKINEVMKRRIDINNLVCLSYRACETSKLPVLNKVLIEASP